MLPSVKQWNMRVLHGLFNYAVVDDIMQVQLVEDVNEDRLVGKEEQTYAGYPIWRRFKKRYTNEIEEDKWSSLWNIRFPPRVKHLLWRMNSETSCFLLVNLSVL